MSFTRNKNIDFTTGTKYLPTHQSVHIYTYTHLLHDFSVARSDCEVQRGIVLETRMNQNGVHTETTQWLWSLQAECIRQNKNQVRSRVRVSPTIQNDLYHGFTTIVERRWISKLLLFYQKYDILRTAEPVEVNCIHQRRTTVIACHIDVGFVVDLMSNSQYAASVRFS